MTLSLDAINALEGVSWQNLIQTLDRSFWPKPQWIQTLCSDPQSSVKVSRFLSDGFTLEGGWRQGCSLSSLFVDISIEPLTQKHSYHEWRTA